MRENPKRSAKVNGLVRKYFFHNYDNVFDFQFLIFTLNWNESKSYQYNSLLMKRLIAQSFYAQEMQTYYFEIHIGTFQATSFSV